MNTLSEGHERRRGRWLDDLRQDTLYGLRTLRRNPAFTAVVGLTLAVGLGATTTIFGWMRAVLLNPLPGVGEPGRVVELEGLAPSGEWVPTSYPDFRDLRGRLKLVDAMSVVQPIALAVADDARVERVWGEVVSGNFFDVLRVSPQRGRFFAGAERDDAQNAHPAVVISHTYWRTRYHSSPQAIGAVLRINRAAYTVIGVAPEGFHGSMAGLSFDMWVPATMYGQLTSTGTWMLEDRKNRMFRVLARLAPGSTIEQARAEARAVAEFMARENADTSEGMSATVLPIWRSHYGIQDGLRAPLGILMGASGVVLLIVCANVANLLLARAADRRRELGIRTALGAAPARLVRQLSTELLLISVGGLLGGLLIAAWLSDALRWLLPLSDGPAGRGASLDGGVLLFSAAVALAVAAVAGLLPAALAARESVGETLKEGGRGRSAGRRSLRVRALLVTSEMALAVVALIGAGLFLKSFYIARGIRPGFDPDPVAIARFDLSAAGFDAPQADAFCRRLREQLERQPGVNAVSYADYVPLSFVPGSWEDLEVEGYVPGRGENMKIYRNLVAPGYFGLMGIPLLEGRDFTVQDDVANAPAMIVTREFARRFVPSGSVVGRKVHGWGKWFTIVGVVEDTKIHRLTEGALPYLYAPVRQIFRPEMGLAFFVRTSGSVNEALAAIRREAQALDGTVPMSDVTPLRDYIRVSLFAQKIAASLLSVLAGIAFLLASIGLYGMMAHAVAQRTNEIGIRLTLGAQRADVLGMVARQGLRFAMVGALVGGAVALALGRLVRAFLVSVSPGDPVVYAAAVVVTIALALVATAIPARRALRVDPIVTLRYE